MRRLWRYPYPISVRLAFVLIFLCTLIFIAIYPVPFGLFSALMPHQQASTLAMGFLSFDYALFAFIVWHPALLPQVGANRRASSSERPSSISGATPHARLHLPRLARIVWVAFIVLPPLTVIGLALIGSVDESR